MVHFSIFANNANIQLSIAIEQHIREDRKMTQAAYQVATLRSHLHTPPHACNLSTDSQPISVTHPAIP